MRICEYMRPPAPAAAGLWRIKCRELYGNANMHEQNAKSIYCLLRIVCPFNGFNVFTDYFFALQREFLGNSFFKRFQSNNAGIAGQGAEDNRINNIASDFLQGNGGGVQDKNIFHRQINFLISNIFCGVNNNFCVFAAAFGYINCSEES